MIRPAGTKDLRRPARVLGGTGLAGGDGGESGWVGAGG